MTVRALEVRAASFGLRGDIPAATSFVGDQWETIMIGDLLDEGSIRFDGTESVSNREC